MKHTGILISLICGIAGTMTITSCDQTLPAERIQIEIQGPYGKLPGEIQRPAMKSKASCPMVIICHGLTGHKSETHLTTLADSLEAHGIASIRCDFNGHGDADGEFVDMTISKEVEDAQAIFDYVNTLSWVDKTNIAISGHSQGGAVAGIKAGDLGTPAIKCLLLMSPAANIHTDLAEDNNMFGTPIDWDNVPEYIDFWGGRHLGGAYLLDAKALDIHARTIPYTGPTFVIQGNKDSRPLYLQALKYGELMQDCKVQVLDGQDHCYTVDVAAAIKPAADFLIEHLK